ncbi:WecB/TagA/CpsF family glycosyltransferase [endosymbiont of unidentified scaly snail isolate Monju]|uniref:WecB/TagA/CpsF family glycosyltransferase n=1 Tax=endosymbiont of unidentified scaly snail isolate Monju TaxID=1248727 RepID=UPI000389212A|nr:WecB/TagA/CpsF family glycosyltransferase [endosymbiont of unidentified scaly snail isolate Monju]BAN68613.1 N-acetylglucosaminyldiphosphoundecaprenol [endosymbiont of unidentified scaly snail isolate Monju]
MKQRREDICGYRVGTSGVEDTVAEVVDWIWSGDKRAECRWLACLNPHSYAESLKDERFAAALRRADWLVPDGAGIVLASRMLGGRIRERVTGSDIFKGVLDSLNEVGGYRVFFLGSTEQTLAEIRARMARDYPRVEVAGTYSPPFKLEYTEQELDEMVEAINRAAPDVLWVGMTAPKQEKWIFGQQERLNVRFAAAIGAVFDFYTGRVKRPHPMFQRMGLEWLPRLVQQPRRLWRRMGVSAPVFLAHVMRQKVVLQKRTS